MYKDMSVKIKNIMSFAESQSGFDMLHNHVLEFLTVQGYKAGSML